MEDWVRAVHVAREVLGEEPSRMPATVGAGGAVRAVVYESWRRSRLQGLVPEAVCPGQEPEPDVDGYLARAVAPIVERRIGALEQASSALSLTDAQGCILRRWAPDHAFAARLDRLQVVPGRSVAEQYVGTTSAINLLSRRPLLVRGPEHFSEHFAELTCAGAPIVHPITRRTVGSLDVTCRLADSSPFALAWVTELAAEVAEALRDRATRRERLLLDAHLAHRHGHLPLVTLDPGTVISSAAAARLLAGLDQSMLWEHAATAVTDGVGGARPLTLADGSQIEVEARPVRDGTTVVGAVMSLSAPDHAVPGRRPGRPPAALPGLVGRSRRWQALCDDAARLRDAPRVLVTGEPGAGRLAVAAAVAPSGPLRVLDAAAPGEPDAWLAAVASELDGPDEVLVLRHADRLDPDLARATEAVLRRRGPRPVFATADPGSVVPGGGHPVLDAFPDVLDVPPLRERFDDLPALLAALSARETGDEAPVRWMADAVQALGRLPWPGNVASLDALVRSTVARRRTGYIGASDLPAGLVARTTRRPLDRLEQAEADTIVRALHDAEGNKLQAAASLGIARSTLYRKVRALGLDLSTATF